jgi:outer membrane receptor protein involved in Fe transport
VSAWADQDTLDPVVVTANRRTQNALDVPYNISTVSGAALENAGATSLVDIARLLPGVAIPDVGARANSSNSLIIIRGLNLNDPVGSSYLPWGSVPTVSTYIDDVPLFVNLRLDDIQRVEVLRGPQGTLYGSGAVAGTIKMEHNPPNLRAFSAEVSADVAQTSHAGNPSYSSHFVLNAPVSETFGLRLSAGFQHQAGFIDATNATVFGPNQQPVLATPASPATSGLVSAFVPHIDDSRGYNLRLAALWKPTTDIVANFAYQRQEDHSNGFSHQTAGLQYQTQALVPQEPEQRSVDLASMTLTGDLGFATVTSSTSYSVNKVNNTYDESQFVIAYDSGAPTLYGHYPRTTSLFFTDSRDRSFTQEFRLSSKEGRDWDYTLGAFFQHQAQDLFQHQTVPGFASWSELPGSADAVNAFTGGSYTSFGNFLSSSGGTAPAAVSPLDTNFTYLRNSSFNDRAAFGELTRHLSERWQVTGGARLSWQTFDQNLYSTIPYGGPLYSTLPPPANATDIAGTTVVDRQQSYHSHTFKLNSSYALSPTMRTYATYSEGFRHGGINALPIGACVFCENPSIVPYKSDTVKNYEIGIKGEADHWLRYSAAAYLINWNDIQIQTFGQAGNPAVVNGGTARSQGLELELNARLGGGWSANLGYGFTDAKLTEDFTVIDSVPQAFTPVVTLIAGRSGDRLPNVPRQTLTADVSYLTAVHQDVLLDAHLNAAYRSGIVTEVNDSVPGFQHLGGFTTINGSVGLSFGNNWHTRLFVNNLADVRGITSAGQLFRNYADPRYNVEYPSRPRTIGIGVDYVFE